MTRTTAFVLTVAALFFALAAGCSFGTITFGPDGAQGGDGPRPLAVASLLPGSSDGSQPGDPCEGEGGLEGRRDKGGACCTACFVPGGWTCAPCESVGSSQWSASGRSVIDAY